MSHPEYRFEIAISFAGDKKRDLVRKVAELLQKKVGKGKVFFDEWFESEIAGQDAQIVLQNIYKTKTRLVVTCVCQRYNEKPWTQDEWRAIQAFERDLRDAGSDNLKRMRFLPLRFGDGDIDGIFSTAIVPDVRHRTPMETAALILDRLKLATPENTKQETPSPKSVQDSQARGAEAIPRPSIPEKPSIEEIDLNETKIPPHPDSTDANRSDRNSIPTIPRAPEFSPSERVVKAFVGRASEVDRVLSAVRRQRVRQKRRPKPGTSLFWYHGFGGMGKTWLLRRIAYLASKPSKAKSPLPAVLLIDWNPKDDTWSPLGTSVSDPFEVLQGVAIRATQVCGAELLKPYWDAFLTFKQLSKEWNSLRSTRLRAAIQAVSLHRDSEPAPIGQRGQDTVPLVSEQAAYDRDMLRDVLEAKGLWSSNPAELEKSLGLLRVRGPIQDEIYEAWADRIAPAAMPDRPLIVRPQTELAEVLRRCLIAASRVRPLFLLLDTCEELSEWTEYWLRKLLVPLLHSADPIVVVVGSRSRPDRYLSVGQRGGWLDQLAGQLEDMPFDKGRHFAVSEIEELLHRSKVKTDGFDRKILAENLHTVTRGVPLALGLLTDRYPELLRDIIALGEIAAGEMSATKAADRINEELATRYLLHVKDKNDLTAIHILALLPGNSQDPEEEPEWFFRSRLSRGRWEIDRRERFRDELLGAVWGIAEWRATIHELERRYALVADGDLHQTIRLCLQNRWRVAEPEGLQTSVTKLAEALERLRPKEGEYNPRWVSWSAWRINIDKWHRNGNALDLCERAIVIGRAHGLNVWELEITKREIIDFNEANGDSTTNKFYREASYKDWTPFERSCAELLEGISLIENTPYSDNSKDGEEKKASLLRGVTLIESNLPILWPGLSDYQRKRISDTFFFDAVFWLTIDGNKPELIDRATALASGLSIQLAGSAWAGLLHNMGRYRESCEAARAGLASGLDDTFLRQLVVHNLMHHLQDYEEALVAVTEAVEEEPYDTRFIVWKAEILDKLGRIDEAISLLRNSRDVSSSATLGALLARGGNFEEAEEKLRLAVRRDPENADAAIELANVLQLRGKIDESVEVYKSVIDLVKSDNRRSWLANHVAWALYCKGVNLDEAERLANLAYAQAGSMAALHTLFAVQARSGKWDAADKYVRQYIREEPVSEIVSEWSQDILFFRDAYKVGRAQWVADRIASELPSPRNECWEIIRLALTGEHVQGERLQLAVRTVREQISSSERVSQFPTPVGSGTN